MPVHTSPGHRFDDSHGNRRNPDKPREVIPVRKVPADSVPYGDSISRNGSTVWAAYDGETLVAVGATADEARAKYRDWHVRQRMSAERVTVKKVEH